MNEGWIQDLAAENYDASPQLYNQRLASYEWGSGEMLFSAKSALTQEALKKAFIEVSHGYTSFESKEDLTCLISFIHEYRHFQQDFFLGIGHWDYIARLAQAIKTLSLCKNLSPDHTISRKLLPDFTSMINDTETIFHSQPQFEITAISNYLKDCNAPVQLAGLFTTRRLLEMDAVLYTYDRFTSLKISTLGVDTAKKLRGIFCYTKMPELYSETIMFCLTEVLHTLDDRQPIETRIEIAMVLLRLVLASALNHPDPATIGSLDADRKDYVPGIKFLRLLKASMGAEKDGDSNHPFLLQLEKGLIDNSGFPYVTYLEAGNGWISFFRNMVSDPLSSATACRLSVLEKQYNVSDQKFEGVSKIYSMAINGGPFSAAAEYDLPLFMRRDDSVSQAMLLTGRALADPNYDIDRIRSILMWRLSEFLSGKRKGILCPLYESGHCEVQGLVCSHPFQDLDLLPDNPECRLRKTCFNDDPRSLFF